MLFPSTVVIAPLQLNTFSKLSTNDENVSDGTENESETNRKSYSAIDDEVYEKIMNFLRSKLRLKCRHIISDNEKNIFQVLKKVYMDLLTLTIHCMVLKKIVLSQQMKKSKNRTYKG